MTTMPGTKAAQDNHKTSSHKAAQPDTQAAPVAIDGDGRRNQDGRRLPNDLVWLRWGDKHLPAVVQRLDEVDYIVATAVDGQFGLKEATPDMLRGNNLYLKEGAANLTFSVGDRVISGSDGKGGLHLGGTWTVKKLKPKTREVVLTNPGGTQDYTVMAGVNLQIVGRADYAQALRDLGLVDPMEEVASAPPLAALAVPNGTLGILEVPLSQLVRSGCNVRSHYDPAAVEELAESLASQGQLENCTGRWNADGQIEIVAGETRRRAWVWLRDAGRVGAEQPVLVHARELSDAEALAISATENMRRRSMTPLEECEAMQRLQDAGRTVEDLAAMFGYKSLQPVADRILVARNLLTTPRELLDRGELSLAQAFVIARAPGSALQNSMTSDATRSWSPMSAADLAKILTNGQFLVKTAVFNVEKSGLEVVRDLFDAFEPYFKSKAKALEAQIAWANNLAEKRRAKGGRAFVTVETGESDYFSTYSSRVYEYASEDAPEAGTVIYVGMATGRVAEEKHLKLRQAAAAKVTASGAVERVEPERQMPESAFTEAHELRARALRTALAGPLQDKDMGLRLTVHALIMGGGTSTGTGSAGIRLQRESIRGSTCTSPVVARRLQQFAESMTAQGLADDRYDSQSGVSISELQGGVQANEMRLWAYLTDWTRDDLLETLTLLVAGVTYDWSPYGEGVRQTAPLYAQLAIEVGAHAVLAESFTLTDEWLKRYPRADLIKLAEEAGLGRALVEDCKTLKAMRGRILEHADRLHAGGFVPKLVQFPAVKS